MLHAALYWLPARNAFLYQACKNAAGNSQKIVCSPAEAHPLLICALSQRIRFG
jgi:hypothetical protein